MESDLQPGFAPQTTNELLLEILAAIRDLKSSCQISSSNAAQGSARPVDPSHLEDTTRHGSRSIVVDGVIIREPADGPLPLVKYKDALVQHKSKCIEMAREMYHLIAHYQHIGGDESVIKSSKSVIKELDAPLLSLVRTLVEDAQPLRRMAIGLAYDSFERLLGAIMVFHKSLYHQKHAFYFREVKQWEDCIKVGMTVVKRFDKDTQSSECLEYICAELFPEIDATMDHVSEELKRFGERSLPTFLADDKERATTRYIHITTIATFFSSVTATTLQFSFTQTSSALGGVVNLFWFLSLVFSVSAGISSLLGMTWRKSSIYNTYEPPKAIRLWLDKAPIVFLVVAAIAFVIGLNLFAYLSVQPKYSSLSINILTGLHSACLLTVTVWFIYHLKITSSWAYRFRYARAWLKNLPHWVSSPFHKLAKKPFVMHTRRNLYWAFERDARVARLNYRLYSHREYSWPDPYLLAKLTRHAITSIKKTWLAAKKAVASIGQFFLVLLGRSSTEDEGMAVEYGENMIHELSKAADPQDDAGNIDPGGQAKKQFEDNLRNRFADFSHRDAVMKRIEYWEKGRTDRIERSLCDDAWLERGLRKLLWGFPELVLKFFDEVYPVLGPIRAEYIRKREEDEANGRTRDSGSDIFSFARRLRAASRNDPKLAGALYALDALDARDAALAQEAGLPPTHSLFFDFAEPGSSNVRVEAMRYDSYPMQTLSSTDAEAVEDPVSAEIEEVASASEVKG